MIEIKYRRHIRSTATRPSDIYARGSESIAIDMLEYSWVGYTADEGQVAGSIPVSRLEDIDELVKEKQDELVDAFERYEWWFGANCKDVNFPKLLEDATQVIKGILGEIGSKGLKYEFVSVVDASRKQLDVDELPREYMEMVDGILSRAKIENAGRATNVDLPSPLPKQRMANGKRAAIGTVVTVSIIAFVLLNAFSFGSARMQTIENDTTLYLTYDYYYFDHVGATLQDGESYTAEWSATKGVDAYIMTWSQFQYFYDYGSADYYEYHVYGLSGWLSYDMGGCSGACNVVFLFLGYSYTVVDVHTTLTVYQ